MPAAAEQVLEQEFFEGNCKKEGDACAAGDRIPAVPGQFLEQTFDEISADITKDIDATEAAAAPTFNTQPLAITSDRWPH